jgi:carbonic anhydrase
VSPTARTLRDLRADGWTAEVVERWIPGANIRSDLFGFVDIVAVRGAETLGVQATSDANVAARVRKIADSELVGVVREAGWRLAVVGWKKDVKSNRWQARWVDVS